jgi:putative endonuclease
MPKNKTGYVVYILECNNGTYYTGYTTDLVRRYQEHLSGSAKCKYTRSFPPKKIAAFWELDGDLSATLKTEAKIKRLPKHKKQQLIRQPELLDLN